MPRVFVTGVREARGWIRRTIGLTGRLRIRQRLWIPDCTSVHTCFMLAPIDILFLDRLGLIVLIFREVGPWRFINGGKGASSVLEAEAGFADAHGLVEGIGLDWE